MPIKFECDKRNNTPLEKEGKYYTFLFDLCTYKQNNVVGPLMIDLPNIVALLLNISDRAFNEAERIYKELKSTINFSKIEDTDSYIFTHEEHNKLEFDMIENLFISIVFAYSACEAFINNLIPIDFEFKEEKPRNGRTALLTSGKEYIERNYSVEEKINRILPLIYKYEINSFNTTPKDNESWEKFKILIEHRNKIIHPKTEKIGSGKPSQMKFVSEIFYYGLKKDLINSAKNLIKNLCDKVYTAPKELIRPPHIPLEFTEANPKYEDFFKF